MKQIFCLFALLAVVPFALSAGKAARSKPATLLVTSTDVGGQQSVLINGSGYAADKAVMIEIDGPTSDTFSAPADGSGDFALYINEAYAPGYYTVTTYQGGGKAMTLMATSGFDVP